MIEILFQPLKLAKILTNESVWCADVCIKFVVNILMVYRSNKSHIEPTFVSYLGSSPFASISNIENRDRIYQHYWNRRFAIPGFWPYACTPWKTSFPWRVHICQNPGIANLNNSTMAILSSKLNSKTSLGNYDSWIRGNGSRQKMTSEYSRTMCGSNSTPYLTSEVLIGGKIRSEFS